MTYVALPCTVQSEVHLHVQYTSLERLQKRSLQSEVFRVPYTFLKALGSVNK